MEQSLIILHEEYMKRKKKKMIPFRDKTEYYPELFLDYVKQSATGTL